MKSTFRCRRACYLPPLSLAFPICRRIHLFNVTLTRRINEFRLARSRVQNDRSISITSSFSILRSPLALFRATTDRAATTIARAIYANLKPKRANALVVTFKSRFHRMRARAPDGITRAEAISQACDSNPSYSSDKKNVSRVRSSPLRIRLGGAISRNVSRSMHSPLTLSLKLRNEEKRSLFIRSREPPVPIISRGEKREILAAQASAPLIVIN